MQIKKIITTGCEFSDNKTPYTWPHHLELSIKNVNPFAQFDHLGLSGQGQDLIQKKTVYAINSALRAGCDPAQIAVFVMWTGLDRKTFYTDNPAMIKNLVENWKGSSQSWSLQLGDLKNRSEKPALISTRATENNQVAYNKNGGWLLTSARLEDELTFIKDFFMLLKSEESPLYSHYNLENILMLQNLCKVKGVRLYQQFSTDEILLSFENNKDHQTVGHLYHDLDRETFISDKSMYGYIKDKPELTAPLDNKPNALGHSIWVNEIILPRLERDGFFD